MLKSVIDRVSAWDSPSLHLSSWCNYNSAPLTSKNTLMWMRNYTVTLVIENFGELLMCSREWQLVATSQRFHLVERRERVHQDDVTERPSLDKL